ncbi:hypothetical protein BGZ61DRAFT_535885 [Ilyonectria robusta]|uniref:uncharacterized protein n=1 Tax=Ilyonectria robusta TaxID=1079257 RepID=UPI001E8DD451|nr:uncharacterized protein BGZ61DRAFT_535885 [Ilyonectria robusta]KAH8679498.1 hypothetical protein BGZ61DRAFT_535885 [Ilyonectria robusta]
MSQIRSIAQVRSSEAIHDIFGAGAAIGITGGSCNACMMPADWAYARHGTSSAGHDTYHGVAALVVADGIEECRLAVRQQIRRGPPCIKIAASAWKIQIR